jgi:biotin carboxylase
VPTICLILPTGTYRAEGYLAAARRLGATVVTASERPQALAGKMGGRFVEVPLDDPERAAALIVARAAIVPIDAVLGVDDQGIVAAAIAGERLGLSHSPPAAVRLTRDKAAMRAAFARGGVPQPPHVVVAPGSPEAVATAAGTLGAPVVVKPCSLAGSRGVIRADSPAEAAAAAARIAPILEAAGEPADSRLLVERFVPGPEVAVEGVLSGGRLDIVAIFDKPDPLDGPFFEETLYVTPTSLPYPLRTAVAAATAEAVAAVGLTDGPVHAELRVPGALGESLADGSSQLSGKSQATGKESVSVLEVAARTIGGRCARALALPGGATLEDLVVARALGLPGPEPLLAGPAGVLMIPIPRSGTLRAVRNIDEVRAMEHVTGVDITVPPGRPIQALPEGDRYLGFVFVAAPTVEAVGAALRKAKETLVVEVEPADTVVG